jgi:hypothetical protein
VNANNEQIIGSVENIGAVMRSAGILIIHIIGFWMASMLVFRRKDILS